MSFFHSPVGTLYLSLSADRSGIAALTWQPLEKNATEGGHEFLQQGVIWLEHYFQKSWQPLDTVSMVLTGTVFQKRVWQRLATIPPAVTFSYGDLAHELQTSPRAIGQAMAANPLPILIPCHRIIGKHQQLGGYSGHGGCKTKEWLLRHESVIL